MLPKNNSDIILCLIHMCVYKHTHIKHCSKRFTYINLFKSYSDHKGRYYYYQHYFVDEKKYCTKRLSNLCKVTQLINIRIRVEPRRSNTTAMFLTTALKPSLGGAPFIKHVLCTRHYAQHHLHYLQHSEQSPDINISFHSTARKMEAQRYKRTYLSKVTQLGSDRIAV